MPLPYNLDIPGQVSEFQLQAIEAVASLVPTGGCVVEVGSLFGRSSWAWAKSVPQDATVYCIDPWEGNQGVRGLEQAHGIKYGIEQFREYIKDCPNIRPIQAYSPDGVGDWDIPVDVYYEDAVHTNPILDRNVKFWTSRLSPNGIACGDDYRPRFADVRAAAEWSASRPGHRLYLVDYFWCALPDARQDFDTREVARKLTELGEAARAYNERELKGARIQISPLVAVPDMFQFGQPQTVTFRIVNDGLEPWPAQPDSLLVLTKTLVRDGEVLAEESHSLGRDQLCHDMPVDTPVVIPFGPPLSGDMTFRIALAGDQSVRDSGFSCKVALKDVPPYAAEEVIRFSSEAPLPVILQTGWALPERHHVWTDGERSKMTVLWPTHDAGTWWLNLSLRPFVAGAVTAQPLSIAINGTPVLSAFLSGPTHMSVPFGIARDAPLMIDLCHGKGLRPVDVLPQSDDRRTLAFALTTLSVTRSPRRD
ncbi:hypothetical protein L288_18035 [Sphingobium quisquiliarum P25]|uniref:Methyltransferase domain-containing protein n=1 Tax=Sphingobium quisquiliarum P25 TaxID=1329909 RepID=T0HST9_9SPHN|nr:class I SAM-dependent methyltransferase [Sphingobium quisquiliarum]EQB00624.1 hypothetical protein L288_18035 [Sphingobium quisquiliarum P25]